MVTEFGDGDGRHFSSFEAGQPRDDAAGNWNGTVLIPGLCLLPGARSGRLGHGVYWNEYFTGSMGSTFTPRRALDEQRRRGTVAGGR